MSAKDGKPEYVKLVAKDGYEFFVERECAMVSGTIRALLENPGNVLREQKDLEVQCQSISAPILERVIQYFYYKQKYQNAAFGVEVPEFVIEPEIAIDVLSAANYLDA